MANDLSWAQDSTRLFYLEPVQADTADISEDSLEKLVPYLDDVKKRTASSKIPYSYIYIFVIALSSLISEDLACIGAGLMVAQGFLEFWPAVFGAVAGIFFGDFSLYFAGRILGTSIFNIAPFKWFLKKESVLSAEKWFESKGPVILVASRFIPGSRFPVYLSAGLLKTGFWKFCLYFGVTVLIWTPIFVWLSVFAGNEILNYYDKYDDYAIWIMIAAVFVLFILYKYMLPLLTQRGRKIAWEKIQGWFNR
ncbi:DedA family protein [Gracilimonas tropica]|uniref:DedA family protein n=1 Tax=Gracilimonas tropica TaxID=454600 RepID=UPI00035DD0E4|nr:DedA family protein [Gracilimonas tropica]